MSMADHVVHCYTVHIYGAGFISKVITVIRFGIDLVFGLIFHAVRVDSPLEIQNHQGSCQKAR